jgi:hypothetical protein
MRLADGRGTAGVFDVFSGLFVIITEDESRLKDV